VLLELYGSSAGVATTPRLDDPFCRDFGNLPGVTVAALGRSVGETATSC